jgi:lipopolysaccharide/colanic/teichoic acid biosynthesis glycosyltransferase
LRERNEQEGLFKIADDPRVTRVGRILRRTSLDELTQLFNVVRGEMSLVGPRPLVPEEDRQIQGWHRRRLHLTPGMTGPWQVLGSSRIPMREMVTIDYLYVANWSLWGDFKILLRTVPHVVLRRGQ